MGATTALEFLISAKDEASKVFDQIGDAAGKQQAKLDKFSRGAQIGLAAVSVAAVKLGADSIKAFAEAETSQTLLETAYAKFPKLAQTNIDSLRDLNSALQAKTGFDDDQTAAAQASLAAYDLTGDQIAALTPLLQDYAAKTGKDLVTAAGDMGKATLGQGRALKAVGIDMKDTGTVAGNLDQIMGGLTEKVGGTADALGDTAAGKAKILGAQMGDLEESIGGLLLPVVGELTDVLVKGTTALNKTGNAGKIVIGVIGGLVVALAAASVAAKANIALQGIQAVLSGEVAAKTGLQTLALIGQKAAVLASAGAQYVMTGAQWAWNAAMAANPIGLVVIAIAALVAGLVWAYNNVDWFRSAVNTAWDWITQYFTLAASVWKGIFGAVWDFLKTMWSYSPLNLVISNWDKITAFFVSWWNRGRANLQAVWDFIKNMWSYSPIGLVTQNWDKIVDYVKALPGRIASNAKGMWDGLVSTFKVSVNKIIDLWNGLSLTIGGGEIMGKKIPSVTLNTPNIPHLASGGDIAQGGWAVVGERGSELAHLPGGSHVYSHSDSQKMLSGTGGQSSDGELLHLVRRLIEVTKERATMYADGVAIATTATDGQKFLAAMGAA